MGPGVAEIVCSFKEGFYDASSGTQSISKKHTAKQVIQVGKGEHVTVDVIFNYTGEELYEGEKDISFTVSKEYLPGFAPPPAPNPAAPKPVPPPAAKNKAP